MLAFFRAVSANRPPSAVRLLESYTFLSTLASRHSSTRCVAFTHRALLLDSVTSSWFEETMLQRNTLQSQQHTLPGSIFMKRKRSVHQL